MTQFLTRDKIPNKNQIVESSGNYLDYIFYQHQTRNKACETFNERKRQSLIRLITKEISEKFTERQKEIFNLKYIDGFKQNEIAEKLNINPSTVCRTLQRAKDKLFHKYGDYLCVKDLFVEE